MEGEHPTPGIIILAIFLGGMFLLAENAASPFDGPLLSRDTAEWSVGQPNEQAFSELALEAKSAFVMNAATGEVLFDKQGQAQLPLASITKVMTAIVAEEILKPNTSVSIHAEDVKTDGNTGLLVGERWHLNDLLRFSLVASSNDGVSAIAGIAGNELIETKEGNWQRNPREAFIAAMNAKADELGLQQTYFLNPTGLDLSSNVSGAYGSARDVAHLFKYILNKNASIFTDTRRPYVAVSSDTQLHVATNTNAAIGAIPGLIAGKTGFTDLGGGNLAVAFHAGLGDPIIAVVLGSSYEARFSDMQTLVRATYSYYNGEE